MTNALTRGAHHIGLAVPDLDTATRFFCDALGFSVAGERPDYPARFVSDGTVLLTLWQVGARVLQVNSGTMGQRPLGLC
jgi:catechol 2,3-dioxygenase-like lactoylglutathione lyase family enzyme